MTELLPLKVYSYTLKCILTVLCHLAILSGYDYFVFVLDYILVYLTWPKEVGMVLTFTVHTCNRNFFYTAPHIHCFVIIVLYPTNAVVAH